MIYLTINNFLNCRSRFFFNITLFELFQKILLCFFLKNKKIDIKLKKKIRYYYPNSNIYLFNHGRSALFFILNNIKNKTTKRKVLINSFTLFEMINMIIYAGFEPIFADNKKNSFETKMSKEILNRNDLACVVVTHLNGFNEDIIKIKNTIKKKNDKIYLIEYCAVSFGAKINNDKSTGNYGDFAILSFNIMKNISSITGGALIQNNKKLDFKKDYEKMEVVEYISFVKKILFYFLLIILNQRIIFPFFFIFLRIANKFKIKFFLRKYRTDYELLIKDEIPGDYIKKMSKIQKLLLLDQFRDLKKNNLIRINNSNLIYENLHKINNFIFPQINFNKTNIYLDFPIICKTIDLKKKIWEKSLENFIDIKNYYYTNCSSNPVYSLYENYKKCKNSEEIANKIIMLPVNQGINIFHLKRVIFFLKNIQRTNFYKFFN